MLELHGFACKCKLQFLLCLGTWRNRIWICSDWDNNTGEEIFNISRSRSSYDTQGKDCRFAWRANQLAFLVVGGGHWLLRQQIQKDGLHRRIELLQKFRQVSYQQTINFVENVKFLWHTSYQFLLLAKVNEMSYVLHSFENKFFLQDGGMLEFWPMVSLYQTN